MRLRACLHQREFLCQFRAQTRSVITHNGHAAAFFGAI